jgi:Zn-dependent peptidase ImmA (M78 family)
LADKAQAAQRDGGNDVTVRVAVEANALQWAIRRSGREYSYLSHRFPALPRWIRGDERPTLRQLESFADATYTPVGYFFLPEPPDEPLPVPDFRTVRDADLTAPSANLLDTIYQCQIRQDWYRGWASTQQAEPLPYVGSLTDNARPADAADLIREAVRFPVPAGQRFPSWSAAVTGLADALGDAGVLVMINGVVGANTSRPLDPEEFRGFTLADRLAPLIFVNGADSKSAQVFTLAHEAAHVWLGTSGVGNDVPGNEQTMALERWCNAVAAEFLVPMEDFKLAFNRQLPLSGEVSQAARRYRVSTLVILTRAHEAGFLPWHQYRAAFDEERTRLQALPTQSSGGNFYATLGTRLGKRFLRALIANTMAGETLYSDAFRMIGIKDQRVFDEIPNRVKLT